MDFKEWLELQEQQVHRDASLILEVLQEAEEAPTTDVEKAGPIMKFFGLIQKIDKWIGITKFLSMLPKAVYAKVMFIFALVKFFKNPLDRSNRENVLHWLSEVGKLSVYSGATIPLAMLIGSILAPGWGEIVAAGIAKAVSYGYFYMGQWAENMKDHPQHGEFARKVLKLLPQTTHAHKEKEEPSTPALAASTLPQNTGEQKPAEPQRPAKSGSFLSRLWPGKRRPQTSSGDKAPSSVPDATSGTA